MLEKFWKNILTYYLSRLLKITLQASLVKYQSEMDQNLNSEKLFGLKVDHRHTFESHVKSLFKKVRANNAFSLNF